MMAIVWANEFNTGANDPDFDGQFNDDEVVARQIVNRAIDDWNAILDTNFDQDNNPDTGADLQLTILAQNFGVPGLRGNAQIDTFQASVAAVSGFAPDTATIQLDDNAGGTGWFFDQTPLDDIEFTSIADSFRSSFIDASAAGQAAINDLYSVVLHEIGHTLGFRLGGDLNDVNAGVFDFDPDGMGGVAFNLDATPDGGPLMPNAIDALLGTLAYVGVDQVSRFDFGNPYDDPDNSVATTGFYNFNEELIEIELWQYTFQNDPTRTVTFTESGGGHFYEGPVNGNTPGADQHLNDLMNPGRVFPVGAAPAETTRQFISDLTVEFLADAYGYDVTLPSTLDSAHVMLDDITGTLLIQGSPRNATTGEGVDDTIDISQVGENLRVVVTTPQGTFTEEVPSNQVNEIVIHDNGHAVGGSDDVTVASNVEQPWQDVDYVVSTNQDILEDGASAGGNSHTNGIIDINTDIPGSQTPLRAAIREANARTGSQSIYLGRNTYDLTLTGGGDNAGDIEILGVNSPNGVGGEVTIIGGGAEMTTINAGDLNDRIFELTGSDSKLNLSHLLLRGGEAATGGAIRVSSGGELNIRNSIFVDNEATGSHGGAIYAIGSAGTPTSVNIENSIFYDNEADMRGGAVYSSSASLELTGNTFTENSSTDGGALHVRGTSSNPGNTALRSNIFAINDGGTSADNFHLTSNVDAVSAGDNLLDNNDQPAVFNAPRDRPNVGIDYVVTDRRDIVRDDVTGNQETLRSAVQRANSTAEDQTIAIGAGVQRLTLVGNGGVTEGDMSINRVQTLLGVGAGMTVIDASQLENRIFDVSGSTTSLHIGGMTLTGGDTTGDGGAIRVKNDGTLTVEDTAFVNNSAGFNGGAISTTSATGINIDTSVFTGNNADSKGGSVFVSNMAGVTAIMTNSVAANNSAATGPDVYGTFVSSSDNLLSSKSGSSGLSNSFEGSFDHVVTSVADTFNHTDNNLHVSIREAVDLANKSAGSSKVWLPAWSFALTLDSDSASDHSIAYGDLDIEQSLTIRIAGDAGVQVNQYVEKYNDTDAAFDLWGDFNGDGVTNVIVGGDDYLIWQQQNGSTGSNLAADANDDGEVDGDDYDIWDDSYSFSLNIKSPTDA